GRRVREHPGLQADLQPRLAPAGPHRPELVRVCGGRLAPRFHPGRAKPPTRRVCEREPVGQAGHGGNRGPPLLEARRVGHPGDARFWKHGGIDYEGIARAAWKDIKEWRIVEGGSTITQQLVRNLYIGHNRTFGRKLKEVCLAMKLGDAWSKRRILKTYMNQVY